MSSANLLIPPLLVPISLIKGAGAEIASGIVVGGGGVNSVSGVAATVGWGNALLPNFVEGAII